MAKCLKACIALVQDNNLVLGTHTKQLRTPCNSRSKGFYAFFQPPQALHSHVQTYTQRPTNTHKKIPKVKNFYIKNGWWKEQPKIKADKQTEKREREKSPKQSKKHAYVFLTN